MYCTNYQVPLNSTMVEHSMLLLPQTYSQYNVYYPLEGNICIVIKTSRALMQ
jgi:hypothetical protein